MINNREAILLGFLGAFGSDIRLACRFYYAFQGPPPTGVEDDVPTAKKPWNCYVWARLSPGEYRQSKTSRRSPKALHLNVFADLEPGCGGTRWMCGQLDWQPTCLLGCQFRSLTSRAQSSLNAALRRPSAMERKLKSSPGMAREEGTSYCGRNRGSPTAGSADADQRRASQHGPTDRLA